MQQDYITRIRKSLTYDGFHVLPEQSEDFLASQKYFKTDDFHDVILEFKNHYYPNRDILIFTEVRRESPYFIVKYMRIAKSIFEQS